MKGQTLSTRGHNHVHPDAWNASTMRSSHASSFHNELDENLDDCTFDTSQHTTTQPAVCSVMEADLPNGEYRIPQTQLNSDMNTPCCVQSNGEVSSKSLIYDQQESEFSDLWPDMDLDPEFLWADFSSVGANTKPNYQISNTYGSTYSTIPSHNTLPEQEPLNWPGLDLSRSSSLTLAPPSLTPLRSTPTHTASSQSSTSSVVEDQGVPPKLCASKNPDNKKAQYCPTAVQAVQNKQNPSASFKKRRFDVADLWTTVSGKSQEMSTPKKIRHSLVEKRYRTKLNDELGRLRTNIPSLRVIPKLSEAYAYREGKEKLNRPEASDKFDKATVVSKAIEYIKYIELCNERLSKEHVALGDRLSAIETLATG